jgi:hypothetical protein
VTRKPGKWRANTVAAEFDDTYRMGEMRRLGRARAHLALLRVGERSHSAVINPRMSFDIGVA